MDRTKLARLLLVVPLLAAGIALGAPRPAAAVTVCDDPLPNHATFSDTTINESLVVPPGALCFLHNVTVKGGITVGTGAVLTVQFSQIRGSITATEPRGFGVRNGSVVRGDVSVSGSVPGNTVALEVWGSEVRGDIVITDYHPTAFIKVFDNTVRSSIVLRNDSTFTVLVYGNEIETDLDCDNISPDPSLSGNAPNTVGGEATGPCADLVAP